ncbi:DAK2 domain-containing protein [Paenibacillus nasutitermitis]|uniref:Kinase n=1 Tax=Paenibacillus nasutitermitis TaxID=1652958 RepID=A0A916YWI1_9BACL|nr:DAK2 domain-containing protein [Paenibacillus nasutitermitis]GGD64936.1 kinase [Paenibacillus nasutitermitis]
MNRSMINGSDLSVMVLAGAACLERNAEHVNALNVFPVPDGDTGTNMNLTMSAGKNELQNKPSSAVGKVAEALSKGLLMGARGNSGVILSQLFRGFAKSIASQEEINTVQFAQALQSGVDMAYKAVAKPVEGTILTVAKEAAKHAVAYARRSTDMIGLIREVHTKADEALSRTPDQLPVLKQVGVVDSGGQGLVYIYEGFLQAITGQPQGGIVGAKQPAQANFIPISGNLQKQPPVSAQSRLATEAIEFFYDMEFFINRKLSGPGVRRFDETLFKRLLARDGDSILVISEDEIIKVHVHTRKPGDVLNHALSYGELTDIHILNMRQQHRDLMNAEHTAEIHGGALSPEEELVSLSVEDAALGLAVPQVLTGAPADSVAVEHAHEWAPYGIIAVAMGEGIRSIFLENNVDIVLSGGQTMNPSTEDFVNAIESLSADQIYLLPNNGNVILAAEQAAELSGRNVTVVPTRTILQGLAAMLAFRDEQSASANGESMAEAAQQVRSGQVTLSIRDTSMDGIEIREGDYLGIFEKAIVSATPHIQQTCRDLLTLMLENGGELVTVLTGEQADRTETAELEEWVRQTYPDAELEVHEGGQPLYPYLFAVE